MGKPKYLNLDHDPALIFALVFACLFTLAIYWAMLPPGCVLGIPW